MFSHGALTSAFARAFNDEMSAEEEELRATRQRFYGTPADTAGNAISDAGDLAGEAMIVAATSHSSWKG